MKLKIKRILLTLSILLLIFSMFYNISFAVSSTEIKSNFNGTLDGDASQKVSDLIGTAINYIANIGTAIAIIILSVIGIKYIKASSGEKADIKKYLLNYVTGAMILFGASAILKIVVKFANLL